jgi:hypothetical protein
MKYYKSLFSLFLLIAFTNNCLFAESIRVGRLRTIRLVLVDADTGKTITTLDKDKTISISNIRAKRYSVVARPSTKGVNLVEFYTSKFQTKPTKKEKQIPYTLFGDTIKKKTRVLQGRALREGNLFFRVVALSGNKAVENIEVTLNVVNGSVNTPTNTPINNPRDGTTTPTTSPTPEQTVTASPDNNAIQENARKVMREKISAWRHKEKNGAMCISCHAPDAYDLAMLNFSDETILRRARPHVPENIAQDILSLVKAVRVVYGITNPPDPMVFRPFQPGGEVLTGKDINERDLKFGKNLVDEYGLRLAQSAPIASLTEAQQARDQFLALDIKTIKVGFPFNRWSEDGFHAKSHNTTADWMPLTPVVPLAEREAEVLALHNAYIQSPTDENFWKIYATVYTHNSVLAGGDEMSFIKYKSNLQGQHIFRRARIEGRAEKDALLYFNYTHYPEDAAFDKGFPSPFWDFGDFSRKFDRSINDNGCKTDKCIGIESSILPGLVKDNRLRDQFKVITLPWFWLGWLMDEGLRRSGKGSNSTLHAEYFGDKILSGFIPEHPILEYTIKGSASRSQLYLMHNVFMFARKTLVECFVLAAHAPNQRKNGLPLQPNWVSFFGKDGFGPMDSIAYKNTSAEFKALYNRFLANTSLMYLYFFEDAINNGKSIRNHSNTLPKMIKVLDYLGPEYAGTEYKRIWESIKDKFPPTVDGK